ncbi:MAG: AAA family ATPase [Solirubrobacterales bacterium]|nr:AAA family ATPase [Solirubrobacterales bacterium]
MKLHRLEITAMGPYAGRVEIDFDRLDEAGVYLLTGPTGSGKTTILDAISYALFAQVPRAAKGAEVVSDHRDLTTTPRVELEATVGGERLRIVRVPEHERPKAKGEGTTTEKQALTVEAHQAGEWRSLTGNWSEGNVELENRVGMNADQFSQVVMLPQGEFARFLKASVRERQELLERLFPGTDLAWLEQWLKHRAEADRKAREAKTREIEDCFVAVRPIAAAVTEGEEDPLPNLAEAGPALAWVEQIRLTLEAIHAERAEALAVATAAADAAATELRRLRDRVELVRRRGEAEARRAGLVERSELRRKIGLEIEAAEKAAGVLALVRTAEQQRGAADRAAAERDRLEGQLGTNHLIGDTAPEDRAAREQELRDELNTIHNFERDDLPDRRRLAARTTHLEAELKQLGEDGPESPVGRAATALAGAESLADGAKRKWLEIREARNRSMAAELAMNLKEGEPCAVCGSTEHPSPAHGDLLQFTAEDEKRAEREATGTEAAAAGARLKSATTEASGDLNC